MSNWTSLGNLALTGVLHHTSDVTVYVTEEGPNFLVVHFHAKKGVLDQLPRPDKKDAIDSKAFRQVWRRAVGDHAALRSSKPLRYKLAENDGERALWVEVAAREVAEALTAPDASEVTGDEGSMDAASVDAALMDAAEAEVKALAGDVSEVEAMASDEPATMGYAGEPDSLVEAAPVAHEAAPEPTPPVMEAAPARPAPKTAIMGSVEGLPGLELAALPATRAPDSAARLRTLQSEVQAILGQGDLHGALGRLSKELAHPASSRRLAENLYLHLAYGRLADELGDKSAARTSLKRAFHLDPRDREVLTRFGALLRSQGAAGEALEVERNLLVHHRRDLDAAQLGGVYRHLGQAHQALQDLAQARRCHELALELDGNDREALQGLMETLEAQGDVAHLVKVRLKLLDQVTDPKARAVIRVSIGDDWQHRLGDLDKALECYQTAAEEAPEAAAFGRVLELASKLGQWKTAAEAATRLAGLHATGPHAAESWKRAAALYQHELGASEQAAACYERALDAAPERLELFQELVSLLVGGERWPLLREAYERMIARAQSADPVNPSLLAALWFKLGELSREYLRDPAGALKAYQAAYEVDPSNLQARALLAGILAGRDDAASQREALGHYRAMLAAGEELDWSLVEKLGVLHLRLEEYDAAWCMMRALAFAGEADERARGFVAQHASQVLKPIHAKLDDAFFRAHLYGEGYDPVLGEVFGIASRTLTKLLAHDLEHYGLRGRDRIDQNEGLVFNKIYHNLGRVLGYEARPQVYRKEDVKGLVNGSLYPAGFLVGAALLSGSSEKEVAFTVAKQLALFRDESFLFQLRPLRDLQFIFYSMAKAANPNLPVNMSKDMERVSKAFRKLEPREQARFDELMLQVLQRKTVNLEAIQTSFEDAANRCGLLFCDDLDVCRQALEAESSPVNAERAMAARLRPLVEWSLSPAYLALRAELGLGIGR